MRLASFAVAVIALLLGTTSVSAQCPDIDVSTYGAGCSVFFTPPELSGAGDSSACTLDLTLTVPPACCNVFAVGRILIVGVTPTSLPIPELGPTCNLLVEPLIFVPLSIEPETITFSIPSSLSLVGVSVFTQGAVEYFTTIGFTTDFTLTNGMRIDFN